MSEPLVYIVLLNWNNHADTVACIQTLQHLTYKNYRILVIDNGSSNDSVKVLSALDNIQLLCNPSNTGFTGGCNLGMETALKQGADYVWLLNNDTHVAADCLSLLVTAAEADPTIGILSPMIYHKGSDDEIQHCGSRFSMVPPSIDEAPNPQTAQAWQAEAPLQGVLWGTALLVPATTIRKIGTLDARLFAYSEDTDYSIRCGLAGLKKTTVIAARIWHSWNHDLRRPYYYYYTTRNDLLMWRKHLPLLTYVKVILWNARRTRRQMQKLSKHPEHINACIAGLWDGLRQKGGEYRPDQAPPPSFFRQWLLRQQNEA